MKCFILEKKGTVFHPDPLYNYLIFTILWRGFLLLSGIWPSSFQYWNFSVRWSHLIC